MSKVAIVYYSATGNTEQMAEYIAAGAKEAGAKKVDAYTAADFEANFMDEYDAVAFGCPCINEELEQTEFEPMFVPCEEKLNSKPIALFGSYGWGDGEWMRKWEQRVTEYGALLTSESVIAKGAPDGEAIEACKALGASLVNP